MRVDLNQNTNKMRADLNQNHAIASRINDELEVFYLTSFQDEEKINRILDEVELYSKALGSGPVINLFPSKYGLNIEFEHLLGFLTKASEFAPFDSPIKSHINIPFLNLKPSFLEEIPNKIKGRYITIGENLIKYFKIEDEGAYGLLESNFGVIHDESEDPRL